MARKRRVAMLSPVLLLIAFAWLSIKGLFSRAYIALGLLVVTLGHGVLFADAESFSYYGTAALASLLIMVWLWLMPVSPLRFDLVIIHLAAMTMNLVGFAMCEAGLEPTLYNWVMTALIVFEWIRLMLRTTRDRDYGYNKHGRRIPGVRSNARSSHYNLY